MAIDEPRSDTSRAIQHDPDQTWPQVVTLSLQWLIDGQWVHRSSQISADSFFGRGAYGAPLPGDAVIMMIEHMRRAGPPASPSFPKTGQKNAKIKTTAAGKRRPQGRDVANRKGPAVRVKRKGPS
jgi:hypothetical protein